MTKARAPRLTALITCLLTAWSDLRADPDFTIDPADGRGTWEAWGTSLCWWAKVFGDREDVADLLFTTKTVDLLGEELPGLGMNYARYNVGACSWNAIGDRRMVVSKIIRPYRQMEGFWPDPSVKDPDDWTWDVDANQRKALALAKDRGARYFELFSNAPMWWMCRNDNPSGAADARDDNLRDDQHEAFARYLTEVAARADREWGVTFTTVSPFNEPMSAWWFADCKQEGCHVSREVQERFIPVLRKTLDARGLGKLPIAASEENTYDEAADTWESFRPAVRKMIGQINVHGYQYGNGRRHEVRRLADRDGMRLWNSEYGDGHGEGIEMARNLLLDFEYLRPTAWAYWQPFDGGGWGLVETDFRRERFRSVNPKYHVLAQFTRHLLPGMKIIGSGSGSMVAGYDRDKRQLALVTLNEGGEREISVDLSRFRTRRAAAAMWVTVPGGKLRYEFRRDAVIEDGTLRCELPAGSVVTIEVRNLDP